LPSTLIPVQDRDYRPDDAQATRGAHVFGPRCSACHGIGAIAAGAAPDLRTSSVPLSAEAFANVVQSGSLQSAGMPRFEELSEADLADLRQYIRSRADAWRNGQAVRGLPANQGAMMSFSPHANPRIQPLSATDQAASAESVYAKIEGPGGRQGGSQLNITRTLAHHPDLARSYLEFGLHVLNGSTLPERVKEIATLRTAWLYDSEYEWTKHAVRAERIGMTREEIAATKMEAESAIWSEFEKAVVRAVDSLKRDTAIDDATWKVLARTLDHRQLLDFLFTVGNYAMLAMVLNGVGVELEPP
jgi:4-carboxymuconolactone decarboxylase